MSAGYTEICQARFPVPHHENALRTNPQGAKAHQRMRRTKGLGVKSERNALSSFIVSTAS